MRKALDDRTNMPSNHNARKKQASVPKNIAAPQFSNALGDEAIFLLGCGGKSVRSPSARFIVVCGYFLGVSCHRPGDTLPRKSGVGLVLFFLIIWPGPPYTRNAVAGKTMQAEAGLCVVGTMTEVPAGRKRGRQRRNIRIFRMRIFVPNLSFFYVARPF